MKNIPVEVMPASASVLRQAGYFGQDQAVLFGWFHLPKLKPMRPTGIVICPPIGHEYTHSHRSLRHLADHLASLGFATLRFDYHGSGDSSGLNEDPQRVAAWLDSVRQAIIAIKTQTGCPQVSLIGVRMGATFAGMIADEQELDSLVLWEPCVQGRRYVRELKALHLTASAHTGESLGETSDIESAGFVITSETAGDLSKLNLKKLTPQAGRILICQREDGIEDTSLRDTWAAEGKTVEQIQFAGYADMMEEPHFTVVPQAVIQQIGDWLERHSPQAPLTNDKPAALNNLCQTATIEYRQYIQAEKSDLMKAGISEHVLQFGRKQALFGIVSEPVGDEWKRLPTIVLLNSGSVHHVGPHRLYVFLARQFAQMGFRCLRLDMSGLGDSYIDDSERENHPYTKTATQDTAAAIDVLKQTHADARFVLMGLCSGAYAAFHAGVDLQDSHIIACVMINPLTFYWKDGMSLAIPSEMHYHEWHGYMNSMRKWEKWLKLLRGRVSILEILRTLKERAQILISVRLKNLKKKLSTNNNQRASQRDLDADLQKIADAGRHISFVFSEHDPGFDLLQTNARNTVKRLTKQGKLSIQMISQADHTFSKNTARQVAMHKLANILEQRFLD